MDFYLPVILAVVLGELTLTCPAGEYWDTATGRCVSCPPGTFNSRKNERFNCTSCYLPNHDLYEKAVKPCTKTRNTEILCYGDHYRNKTSDDPEKGKCVLCSVCGIGAKADFPKTKTPCGDYTDTECTAPDTPGKDEDTARAGLKLQSPVSTNMSVYSAARKNLSWSIGVNLLLFFLTAALF